MMLPVERNHMGYDKWCHVRSEPGLSREFVLLNPTNYSTCIIQRSCPIPYRALPSGDDPGFKWLRLHSRQIFKAGFTKTTD